MIHLYVAETFEGFHSLKLEVALTDAAKILFPEIENGIPRTELELDKYLKIIFDQRNLLSLKNKIAIIFSTSEHVLNFFRILILDNKLSENDFLCIFITKELERLEIKCNTDGRLNLGPAGFFVLNDRNLDRLLEGKLK